MNKVALSIKNPVSYLVASGAKWVENRTWKTDYRGRIYIHSSGDKSFDCLTVSDFPTICADDYKMIQKKLGNDPTEESIIKVCLGTPFFVRGHLVIWPNQKRLHGA